MPLTKAQERVMLGLRLDEPLPLAGLEPVIDRRCARADGARRARDRRLRPGRRGDARAHRARPVPRRRGHGRAARLRPAPLEVSRRRGAYRRGVEAPSPFVPDGFELPPGLVSARFVLEPLGPQHNEADYAGLVVVDRPHPGDAGLRGPVVAARDEPRGEPREISRSTHGTSRSASASRTRCSIRVIAT